MIPCTLPKTLEFRKGAVPTRQSFALRDWLGALLKMAL